jgi:integration host factor subunit beta
MIKSELVQRIAENNPHLYLRDVENIVNAILDEITGAAKPPTTPPNQSA